MFNLFLKKNVGHATNVCCNAGKKSSGKWYEVNEIKLKKKYFKNNVFILSVQVHNRINQQCVGANSSCASRV